MATTTKYKPYPKMKCVGVEWIGKIPDEWDAKRVRYVLNSVGGNGFPEELQGRLEGDYPFYKVSDINGEKIFLEKSNNYVDRADVLENNWKVVPKGSIVTAKIGAALSLNHRKITTKDSLIDNNMLGLSLKSEKFDSNYVYYLFKVIDMDWFVNPGAVPSVNIGQFIDTFLPFPQKEEQKTIVVFLDRETVKIDNVVAKKQKLIELLKEKRQALITHAVTKGLDPKVKMKSSGIDWLGDIPEKWEIWKYGHLFLSSMGETILREDLIDDGKIPVYSATEENVNFGYVDSASVILNKGDLVIPARGNSIGNVKLVDKLSTTTQTTIYSKLIKKSKIDVRYVLYLLAGLKNIYFFFDRTAIPQITVDQVQNNDLCIPSLIEQETIADFLDRETTKIDGIIKKVETQIEKLQEYRQALISNAVTGKIKV